MLPSRFNIGISRDLLFLLSFLESLKLSSGHHLIYQSYPLEHLPNSIIHILAISFPSFSENALGVRFRIFTMQ